MDAAVVKFDALADADGAGAEYDVLFLAGILTFDELGGLVFVVVGGVEIGGLGGELSGAGVHHFVGGVPGTLHFLAGNPFNGGIQIAVFLGLQVKVVCQGGGSKLLFQFHQVMELS